MASELTEDDVRELDFARRWVDDNTGEYHHEGGDRVMALLEKYAAARARIAELERLKAVVREALRLNEHALATLPPGHRNVAESVHAVLACGLADAGDSSGLFRAGLPGGIDDGER